MQFQQRSQQILYVVLVGHRDRWSIVMPLRKGVDHDYESVADSAHKRDRRLSIAWRIPCLLDTCSYCALDNAFGGVKDKAGVSEVIAVILVQKSRLKHGGRKLRFVERQADPGR